METAAEHLTRLAESALATLGGTSVTADIIGLGRKLAAARRALDALARAAEDVHSEQKALARRP